MTKRPLKYDNLSPEELERLAGFAPGELEKEADAYASGKWPEGKTVRSGFGRPPLGDEPSCVVSGRVTQSVATAFDAKAKAHGQTRAERVRELVMADVASA